MENNSPSQTVLKQTARNNLKSQYGIAKWIQAIWIVALESVEHRKFIIEWLSDIGIWAVVLWTEEDFELNNISSANKINSNNLIGFDFFIYDNNFEWVDVIKYMWAGIVPIMPENNTYSGILKDFNPMKFEWNWFFRKKNSPYCIFEKVISYLENIKFPEDKRTLIKNVAATF